MNTLKAEKRSMSEKAKKLRREGYVTGNVFGRSIAESIPVQIEKKEAEKFLSVCGKGSEAQLSLEGQQYDVLVKEVDYDPIKRQTLEITRFSKKAETFSEFTGITPVLKQKRAL